MTECPLPPPGTPAPTFSLPGTTTAANLEEYRGRWVVLYFYPKDNTPGCTTEAREFSTLREEFDRLDCVVLGVSPDSVASHQKFTDKHHLRIELLSDPDHDVIDRFGAWRRKKNYGREYFGVVRSTVLIDPHGVIRHVWPSVRATGHAANVLETLRRLTTA